MVAALSTLESAALPGNPGQAESATLVNAANRAAFEGPIREMHAARKQVFVDQLRWSLPVTDDTYEIDEYDTEDAVYLIVQDAGTGGHLGSVRLLPTSGAHLLGDKFDALCEGGAPRGADTWEITRMVTRPGLPRAAAERVREQLSVALIEYGLASGIVRYTMMTHTAFLSAVLAVGWDCEPLGLPVQMDGVAVGALAINVDTATLGRLRDKWSFGGPVLRLDLSHPAIFSNSVLAA